MYTQDDQGWTWPPWTNRGSLELVKTHWIDVFAKYGRLHAFVVAAGNGCGNIRELNSKNRPPQANLQLKLAAHMLTCQTSNSDTTRLPYRPVRTCLLRA